MPTTKESDATAPQTGPAKALGSAASAVSTKEEGK